MVTEAGVASVLAAGSVARTWKVWDPSANPALVYGEVHAPQPPSSIWHSNFGPACVDVNVQVGVLSFVKPLGPLSIVVFGAAVSTVTEIDAGVGSVLAAESVART